MTKEEEDKNVNIVRDKDGNVMSEATYGTKEESDIDVALNLQESQMLDGYSSHDWRKHTDKAGNT